jgi:hypothetical protein
MNPAKPLISLALIRHREQVRARRRKRRRIIQAFRENWLGGNRLSL